MASRNIASKEATSSLVTQTPGVSTTKVSPTTSSSTTSGGSTRSASKTYNESLMDPKSLAALNALIKQLQTGGTAEQKKEQAVRDQQLAQIYSLLQQVSPEAARVSAESLMALNLQRALEENMPAISRAVEGAGMNTSTLQGVLSSQLARDASLAAGALGAQQEAAFASQRSNLAALLEPLTRPTNNVTTALINALQVSKGATRSGTENITETGTNFSNQMGWESGKTITKADEPTTTLTQSPAPDVLAKTLEEQFSRNPNVYSQSGMSLLNFLRS